MSGAGARRTVAERRAPSAERRAPSPIRNRSGKGAAPILQLAFVRRLGGEGGEVAMPHDGIMAPCETRRWPGFAA